MNEVVFVILPYSILFLYGLRMKYLSDKQLVFAALVFLVISSIIFFNLLVHQGVVVLPYHYKTPPRLYFLSYALFAIHVIYYFSRKLLQLVQLNRSIKLVVWLSSHSLWVYLWHIMAFYFWKYGIEQPNGNLILSLIKTGFLLSVGCGMTYLQLKLLERHLSGKSFFHRKIAPLLV